MADSDFTSDTVSGKKRDTVVPFPCPRPQASDASKVGAASARVLPISRRADDGAFLEQIAPWTRNQLGSVEVWRSSLFMSRFEQSIEQNMGRATMARVQWKAKFKTDIRGKFSTPAGNVLMEMISSFRGSYIRLAGHRDALLLSKLAQPHWLHTSSRSSRPNEFDAFIFGVERHLKVRRNRERYEMNVELTDEEHEAVQPERLELFEKAQSGLLEEIDKLPKTASEHLERFLRLVDLQTRVVQSFVCESRGGFALDAPSCTAILTQLEGLRQTMCQAKAKFDREARRSEITCIARKYAPSNLSISVART